MTHYLFGASAEGWSTTDVTFNGADGYPSPGCLSYENVAPFTTKTTIITGLSISLTFASDLAFATKFTGTLSAFNGSISLAAYDASNNLLAAGSLTTGSISPGVWKVGYGIVSTEGTAAKLEMKVVGANNALTGIFFDSVYVNETFPTVNADYIESSGGIPGSIMVTT